MKPFDFTILIPTIPKRKEMFEKLKEELYRQIKEVREIYPDIIVTIDSDDHEFERIGTKRNRLLQNAISKYVAFFDDDDWPGERYVLWNVKGIINDADCCSLLGEITWDGLNPELFEHSIKNKEYRTTNNLIKYERYPNHLNCIKSDIAKQFVFPEINHGEDKNFADQLFESGLLKNEFFVNDLIYHYRFKPNK